MIHIKVTVDKADLIAKLEMFSAEMKVGLYPAWARIAGKLHRLEIGMAPVDTGRLKRNIQTQAYVMGVRSKSDAYDPRNGYNYARIQHDGGYASGWAGPHWITAKQYMVIPLYTVAPSMANRELSEEITKIIARCGLG